MHILRILFLCIITTGLSLAQKGDSPATSALTKADSLFNARKYTESFELYDFLLSDEKVYTPAMLLKMAFIKEGLGDYSQALYYLNIYYLKTADKKVLDKMEQLAEARGLKGYKFTDFEFVQTAFFKYFDYVV